MRTRLLMLCALCFAGCATPEQRAAQQKQEIDKMMAIYGPACTKLGYASNSDAWRDCILKLDAKDSYEQAEHARLMQACMLSREPIYFCTGF